MNEVVLKLNEKGHGGFYIMEGQEQLGEMVIAATTGILTVYHTEVSPKAEGKGLAKLMLQAMADHARKNKMKVVPLCPYVLAQFKRHPHEYAAIWKRKEEGAEQ